LIFPFTSILTNTHPPLRGAVPASSAGTSSIYCVVIIEIFVLFIPEIDELEDTWG
jgi:hypothetical protein